MKVKKKLAGFVYYVISTVNPLSEGIMKDRNINW